MDLERRGMRDRVHREVDTSPVAKVATVLEAASRNGHTAPFDAAGPGVAAVSRRRRNRRYSLVQKQTATKNATIPVLSVRTPGRPLQYGALRFPGQKLLTRHTLAQHSPAPYASPVVTASSASHRFVPPRAGRLVTSHLLVQIHPPQVSLTVRHCSAWLSLRSV
jgi:hypothetical protein